jgi:hypothetical protein
MLDLAAVGVRATESSAHSTSFYSLGAPVAGSNLSMIPTICFPSHAYILSLSPRALLQKAVSQSPVFSIYIRSSTSHDDPASPYQRASNECGLRYDPGSIS